MAKRSKHFFWLSLGQKRAAVKGSADSWFFNVVDATSDLIVVGHNSFYRFRVTDHDDDDIVFSRQLVSDGDDVG